MIVKVLRALSLLFFLPVIIHSAEFDNRVRLGMDARLVYQRQVLSGWWLGTDLKGETSGAGDPYFSMNTRYSYWLLTLSRDFEWSGFRMENSLKYFGNDKIFSQLGYVAQLSRVVDLVDNVRFTPTFTALDYLLDLDPALGSLPVEKRHAFSVIWGLSLQFEYLF